MTKTVYELMKNSKELRSKLEIEKGCTVENVDCIEPEFVKTFETKEEALEELKKYNSFVETCRGNMGEYYIATEYYVNESDYFTDDGEDTIESYITIAFSEFE